MVLVASIAFSTNPNVEEATIGIHREKRGERELWVARPIHVDFLPFPSHPILQNVEIPLRYLAAKDESDPKEIGDSRGLERAVSDLFQILGADSSSLFLIEMEWFANFDAGILCAELSQQMCSSRSNWVQLRDRMLEDENVPFEVDVNRRSDSGLHPPPGVFLDQYNNLQIERTVATDLSVPKGTERTGILVDNRAWIMLAGNPRNQIFVPFCLEWAATEDGLSEIVFVPDIHLTVLDDGHDSGQRVQSGRTPSGCVLFFTQSESDCVGSVRVEHELLPRPWYENLDD